MVRKIRIRIFPEHANLLSQFVELASREHWPEAWNRLREMAQKRVRFVQKTYTRAMSLAQTLHEHGFLECNKIAAPEEEECEPFVAMEFSVDLADFLEQESGQDALNYLASLLESLDVLEGFEIRVWLGRHRSTITAVLEEVDSIYRAFQVTDGAGEEGDSHPRKRRKRQAGTSSAQEFGTEGGASGQADESGGNRSKRKRGARNGRIIEHSEAAQFFLQYTSLSWPCSEQELNKAWRHALHNSHPDKFPDDPHAKNRTQLINQGYRELKAIVHLV